VHDPRAGTAAAIVEIDDGAIEGERLLDFSPVVLVGRNRDRRVILDCRTGGEDARVAVVAKRRRQSGGSGRAGRPQELSPGPHEALLWRVISRGQVLYFNISPGSMVKYKI
jgi:hypothetical protein